MFKAHLHLPRLKAGNRECISVKTGNHPTFYTDELMLKDVIFKVYRSGRDRAIKSGQRNVHAYVVGNTTTKLPAAHEVTYRRATYNPFKSSTFVDAETNEPVTRASYALMSGKDVYYVA